MVGRDRELGLLMHWPGTCRRRRSAGGTDLGRSRRWQVAPPARAADDAGAERAAHADAVLLAYHQASALYPVINYYQRLAGIAHDDSQAQKLTKLESLLLENGAVLERTAPILATRRRFR